MSAGRPIPPGVIYLDYAATSPLAPEVRDAMAPYLSQAFGNASTLYSLGTEAREAVEAARVKVAELLGARDPAEIVFTSGGTESDNAAMRGVRAARPKERLVCSAAEHHAVLDTCKAAGGADCVVVGVDSEGFLGPDALRDALPASAGLVSIMHANNEIGTILPIKELAEVAHGAGALFHTDAVQSVGKIPVNVEELGVDLLSLSAHKFYGPKGVGALYVQKGTKLQPTQTGGGQEQGRRGGTSNVAGIVGLGKAAEMALAEMDGEAARLRALQAKLIDGVLARIPDSRLNGPRESRLPHNAHFCFKGCEGESILLDLDLLGICCSAGAACTSGATEMSHVLSAIGVEPEWGQGALRISLGKYTTEADIEAVIAALENSVGQLRRLSTVPPVTK
jgi:cysteine desulfurase